MKHRHRLALVLVLGAMLSTTAFAHDVEKARKPSSPGLAAGLGWLRKHQLKDGGWAGNHRIAVTSFACLAFLGASDDPLAGDDGQVLVRGLRYLLQRQKDGLFAKEGHTWIHGQGFATLALAEAHGVATRTRQPGAEPPAGLDLALLKRTVVKAVGHIQTNQSTSGGWWYVPGRPHQHEGSTTCCAVQALASARNHGVPIDEKVLAKGFEYLKQCQNADGGFDYKLGDTKSMKEGTAGGVATLGLMRKFDYDVMMKGYGYLLKITHHTISDERFPYYGFFYGSMGLRLLGQEFDPFLPKIRAWIRGAQRYLEAWQRDDGSFPLRGWPRETRENPAYATAFACLVWTVDAGRLSIYNRDGRPPRPKPKKRLW